MRKRRHWATRQPNRRPCGSLRRFDTADPTRKAIACPAVEMRFQYTQRLWPGTDTGADP